MKRTLAIILALVLCVGVFATVGFAAETAELKPITSAPAADTAYKFGLYAKTLDKTLYFTGEMSGYFLATTEDVSKAADVYVETVEGGYKLYFKNADKKQYIEIYTYENSGKTKVGVHIADEASYIYKWDSELNLLSSNVNGSDYYLGTYYNANYNTTYETMSASKTSYITGDNAAKIGETQFPAYLYEAEKEDEPVEAGKVTVHAKVPAAWENASIWAWRNDGSGNAFEGSEWPGNAMTKNGDWYEIEIPADIDRVIINDGKKENAIQTADLEVEAGKEVWITVNDDLTTSISYTNPNSAPSTPVEKPEDNKDNSKTGDATALVAISAAMLLAATGVVAVVSNKKHF